ncbi:MAG TPA: hypothetical protein VGM10_24115 [Actinocrinis sp.]
MSASHGDYKSMSHQQLYDYASSGSLSAIDSSQGTIKTYATDLDQATTDLSKTLSAIQQDWTGAASDSYFEQAQAVVTNMQGQVSDAQNTAKALGTAYNALAAARHDMPHPPSEAEKLLASVNNAPAGLNILAGVMTDGTSAIASKQAQAAINNSRQKAISTMEALAAGYEQAQSELPDVGEGIDKKKDDSSQSQTQTGTQVPLNGGAGAVVPIFYPSPASGLTTGASGAGSGSGSAKNPGAGSGSPQPGTSLQGAGATAGAGSGPIGATTPTTGLAAATGGAGANASGLVGVYGAGSLSTVSPSGLFGEADDGGYAGAGVGGGAGAADFGDEGTAALGLSGAGGVETGGEAVGAAGSADGLAAADGAAPAGTENQGSEGPMGGMGGRGGGAGSGDEQRANSQYIREDEDYWYGDKKYAPPGGLIE